MNTTKDPWWWLSFCQFGKNTGVCNVQAPTKEEALQKTIELKIHPRHDDIACYKIDKNELEPDKLYTPEEMRALKYQSHNHK
jgi:hypothetical protein